MYMVLHGRSHYIYTYIQSTSANTQKEKHCWHSICIYREKEKIEYIHPDYIQFIT